jgi:type I restriction enzyme, S subunit
MTAVLRVEEPSARYIVQRELPLLRGFELLASAPAGVAKLRALIHSLAIRGLLVSRDPSDEPASALIVGIRAAKDRLIADGKLRPDKMSEQQVSKADEPFVVPATWDWVRFGAASINRDGERVPVASEDRQQRAKVFDYYGASGVIDKIDGYLFDKTLLLIGEDGANLINRATPIAFLASGKYWVNNHAHVIDATHPGLLEYLCLFINAISLEPYITGTAQPKMNQAKLNSIPVALPPLAEQHRIVARVEELMKLCDALEQSGRLADEQHARLTSTLFDTLAASESAHALAENWQRVAEHFDLLLDRPEAIDALEQTILQLAVRGLLAPQHKEDEPANALVIRISAPRKQVRTRPVEPISAEEIAWELPASWHWVRLSQVADARLGKMLDKTKNRGADCPYLRNTNVQWHRFQLDDVKTLRLEPQELDEFRLQAGDLLVCEGGEPGRCAIWNIEGREMYFQKALHRVRPLGGILAEYLELHLRQDADAGRLERYFTGATIKHFAGQELARYVIALPPVAEQHRIVARVEELRRLCAQLRERLTDARRTQSRLAEALVQQVTNTPNPSAF